MRPWCPRVVVVVVAHGAAYGPHQITLRAIRERLELSVQVQYLHTYSAVIYGTYLCRSGKVTI